MAYCARFVDLPAKLGRLIFHVQACVASVSLQFRSKERTREKWGQFHFSRGQNKNSSMRSKRSVRFRSKERGKRVNDRAKNGAS